MSSTTLFVIAALTVSVALAQPFVSAPLMPLYNFADGSGTAQVQSAIAGEYAFTANTKGVYALNMSAPTNVVAPFFDALEGVTQLLPYGNYSAGSLIAIAGSTIALYKTNLTHVWRAATFTTKNATFDLQTDSSSSPSYMYPVAVEVNGVWAIVLGTQNTSTVSNGVRLPSTVYALSMEDLSVAWSTVVNSDTTNYATSADDTYVWILTKNTTYGYSNTKVRKVYIVNGTVSDWIFDSGFSNTLVHLSIANGQFFLESAGGYNTLVAADGTVLVNSDSVPSCSTMPYQPLLLNGTWIVVCGSYLYEYNNATGAKKTTSLSSNIRCGAVQPTTLSIVFVAGSTVYVRNASGVQTLATLPSPMRSSYNGYCVGAVFGWKTNSTAMKTPIPSENIVYLSFTAYYSGYPGNVLALNYQTGDVLFQISGDVEPIGPIVINYYLGRAFVASTEGAILQGYNFVSTVNSTSFAAYFPSVSTMTFSVAYNATNRSTYFITDDDLYTVDRFGNQKQLVSLNMYYSQIQPMIIGQYLVIVDSYYDRVYVYDSVKNAVQRVSICSPSTSTLPIVNGMQYIIFCSSSNSYGSTAAQLIDVSASTIAADGAFTPKSNDYPRGLGGAVVGTTLVLATTYQELRGFNIAKSPATAATVLWTAAYSASSLTPSFVLISSSPVAYEGSVYFTAQGFTLSAGTFQAVYKISPLTGVYSNVLTMKTNIDAVTKTLLFKTGGVFGSGIIYAIGAINVTAYDLGYNLLFTYKHNGTIMSHQQGNPTVLESSGAVCFYDSNGNFNVVGGFKGGLAWQYPATSVQYYPILTDNTSVYFSDGSVVVGAYIWSGGVTSISTILDGTLQGFAIAAGANITTVVGATTQGVVYGQEVYPTGGSFAGAGAAAGGAGPNSAFPGAGSASGSGAGGSGDSSSGVKGWVVAVIIVGVLALIAVVIVVVKMGGGSKAQDDNYVPMNPATQV